LSEVAEEAVRMHLDAFGNDPVLANMLDAGGEYAYRVRGEEHMWTPDSIAKLQHATRTNNFNTYKEYAKLINDQAHKLKTLRGLFEIKSAGGSSAERSRVLPKKSSSALSPVQCRWARFLPRRTLPWLSP
jgi:glutamate synthase (NADPH/NADH) large chain